MNRKTGRPDFISRLLILGVTKVIDGYLIFFGGLAARRRGRRPLAFVALGFCLRWMNVSADVDEESDMRRAEVQSQPAKLNVSLDDLERLTSLQKSRAQSTMPSLRR